MSLPRSHCRKAIIALAGYGTRRLPITKSIEKSMLPIGNRPIIDYIVDDCINAGMTDIIFVVGEQSSQIRSYYQPHPQLEKYLLDKDAKVLLDELKALNTKARFSFITQPLDSPYGTSTPLWLAKDLLGDEESFLYMYGDNIFYTQNKLSTVAQFVHRATAISAKAAMMVVQVPEDQVSKYGIVATKKSGGIDVLDRIVEKPKPAEAPSCLNNAGCFLLRKDIFPYIDKSINNSPQTEKYVTDAVTWYANDAHDVAVIAAEGEYLDCGNVEGWLYANNRICGV